MSRIRARFRATLSNFTLDAEFSVPAKGVTGLIGPSGSGKTTLLRCIAGLIRASDAYCAIDDVVWQDSASARFVPVHARGVGYVFQEPSLFPHLSVRKNVLYGHKRAKSPNISLDDAIEWTGIAPLLDRKPAQLSGGERQRVAIARALACSPKLLLMDEPMASLDEGGRAEIIPYLDRLHRHLAVPIILVSHSLREIACLSDCVLWMRNGHIEQCGPVGALVPLLAAAASGADDGPFTLLDATVLSHDSAYLLTSLRTAFGVLLASKLDVSVGTPIRLQIPARDVSLAEAVDPRSSILNQLPVRILAATERPGGQLVVSLAPLAAEQPDTFLLSMITRKSWDHLALASGKTVYARIKGVSILR